MPAKCNRGRAGVRGGYCLVRDQMRSSEVFHAAPSHFGGACFPGTIRRWTPGQDPRKSNDLFSSAAAKRDPSEQEFEDSVCSARLLVGLTQAFQRRLRFLSRPARVPWPRTPANGVRPLWRCPVLNCPIVRSLPCVAVSLQGIQDLTDPAPGLWARFQKEKPHSRLRRLAEVLQLSKRFGCGSPCCRARRRFGPGVQDSPRWPAASASAGTSQSPFASPPGQAWPDNHSVHRFWPNFPRLVLIQAAVVWAQGPMRSSSKRAQSNRRFRKPGACRHEKRLATEPNPDGRLVRAAACPPQDPKDARCDRLLQ